MGAPSTHNERIARRIFSTALGATLPLAVAGCSDEPLNTRDKGAGLGAIIGSSGWARQRWTLPLAARRTDRRRLDRRSIDRTSSETNRAAAAARCEPSGDRSSEQRGRTLAPAGGMSMLRGTWEAAMKSRCDRGGLLALLLFAFVAFGGCAGGELTTREEGAGIGALGGAAAGGIIGAAVGHPGAGAAIGGALGLGAGALVGDQLQGQEQKQAEQQRQIDANQAELDRQRRELERIRKQGE